jgi:hypothetical protein
MQSASRRVIRGQLGHIQVAVRCRTELDPPPSRWTWSIAPIHQGYSNLSLSIREAAAMAAVRRAPKSISGGRGNSTEPPSGERFIIRGRIRLQPANDNPPVHGGRGALGLAVGIVLTLVSYVFVLRLLF